MREELDWLELAPWNSLERVAAIADFCEAAGITFEGKTVLDLGCNTGHLTCLALMRAAASVVAIDAKEGHVGTTEKNVKTLLMRTPDSRSALGSCSAFTMDVFDVDLDQFDIILCCGLIYHTERQLELLKLLKASSSQILLEGMSRAVPSRDLQIRTNKDETLWVPNDEHYEQLFSAAGLRIDREEVLQSKPTSKTRRKIFSLAAI